ncbi:hypothetical protein MG293_011057 [Ovis ammon polii]|uniref:Uncharacterized protein n=1 Tax=Ovis ammon polii TaxID=230172 RepID=A0AAD4U857_OVIAM|nr:hypothetical protein MG293_011057 [Ovis ammon polii]KAI4565211.1 hypothetical protein MJT46_009554 [Ovis ammon polii x Ovis aries]
MAAPLCTNQKTCVDLAASGLGSLSGKGEKPVGEQWNYHFDNYPRYCNVILTFPHVNCQLGQIVTNGSKTGFLWVKVWAHMNLIHGAVRYAVCWDLHFKGQDGKFSLGERAVVMALPPWEVWLCEDLSGRCQRQGPGLVWPWSIIASFLIYKRMEEDDFQDFFSQCEKLFGSQAAGFGLGILSKMPQAVLWEDRVSGSFDRKKGYLLLMKDEEMYLPEKTRFERAPFLVTW